jgi:TetR/AcrR family transcriptional repressor of nem operon
MPMKAPNPRSDTAEQILDLAEALIQTRGYSAFSYQDISDPLGIRKASIHYHFPSKTDLGIAVVDRYVGRFETALAAIAGETANSAMAMLDHYFAPYLEFGATSDKVCLCGALAGEMMALPPELRARVDLFFRSHQAWLANILKRGVARGEFHLSAAPAKTARLVFGALQGALLVKRTTGDASQLRDVVAAIKSQLAGETKNRRD